MTKNPPEPGQYGYGYPQYGDSNPSYGNYASGEGSSHNYQQPPPGQGYGGYNNQAPAQGSAQSYYGSNDQPYQQYPPDQQHQNQYQGGYQQPPHPDQQHYGQQQQNYGQPQQHQSWGGQPQPPPAYGSYGQDYTPPPQHFIQQPGSEVDNFRSHFDHPNAPPNASGHYGDVPPNAYGAPHNGPPGSEGDRGVMGALAGGAAGAYGGHKMHHGVIGGIGGAVAGSMLEDAYKKHNKKDKKEKKHKHGSRRNSSSSSSSSSDDDKKRRRHGGHIQGGGNFHGSSRGARLEGRCTLVAECCDMGGHHRNSALELNDCLTNNGGRLEWQRGGNFAASAERIKLKHDHILIAKLGDGRGGWQKSEIDLNERIGNDNGRLHYLG